jgi:hypothetical protein
MKEIDYPSLVHRILAGRAATTPRSSHAPYHFLLFIDTTLTGDNP